MLTRSKGLFLSLFALLGVFYSSYSFASVTTIRYTINDYSVSGYSYMVLTFDSTGSASKIRAGCRAYFGRWDGDYDYCFEGSDGSGGRIVSHSYYSDTTVPPDEMPRYNHEDGSCLMGSDQPDCQIDSDRDGDGIPNVIDSDSGVYDGQYCYDNPDSQLCIDNNGGDTGWTPPDDTGGDTGGDGSGGDGSGGGTGGGTWSPPVGSECSTEVDSQSCCTDYGQFYCQDKGGLASADWTDIGGLSCSVTCSDDVIDPPTDGGGGDDGSGGTGGDSGGTGDAFDDSGIVSAIQNASSENSTALNSLQTEITSGFSGVSSDIVDMNNNLATGINGVGSELSTLNATASDIRSNTSETASAVSELENSLSDIFTINPDTLDGGLDPDSANIDANEYFDGVFATGDLEERTGLDSGASLDTRVIDISELSGDFQPMLGGSSSECPAPYEITVAGTQTSISFDAVCDAFAILSIFVQAAAWFATPFIILGVSKG